MSPRLAIGAALVVVTAAVGVGCTPDAPPDTTTTTLPGFPPIAVGCHDGLGSDVYFMGPIDTIGNHRYHFTNDGSCGQAVNATHTMVQASSPSAADQRCAEIGKTAAYDKPLDDPSFGYSTLHSAYQCY